MPLLDEPVNRLFESALANAAHAIGKGADARNDEAARVGKLVRRRTAHDLGTDLVEPAFNAQDVARAVVANVNSRHAGRLSSCPHTSIPFEIR